MLAYQVCECSDVGAGRARRPSPGRRRASAARRWRPARSGGHGVRRRRPARGSPKQCTSTSIELAQLADQVLDVHPGAAVDVRRVLAGQRSDAHDRHRSRARTLAGDVTVRRSRPALGSGYVSASHARAGPRVLGIVLAGGEGKRLMPLTADRAKPAVPFGGNYRLIDFVLSNLVNAGLPADLRAHAVQVALARPAHHHDLADVDPARQLRHPGAGAAAARPALVHRQRRRDLPVPQPVYDEQPDYIVVFGADHVYRMDPRQMVDAHIETGAGRHGRRASGCRAREATAFGVHRRRAETAARSREFLEKPADPPAAARRPRGQRSPRWATTSSPPTRCSRRSKADAEDERLRPRHGRRHHPDAGRARARRRSTTSPTTTCPAPPSATAATGATSGRSTPTTRRTWTWCRCTRSSTSTTSDWPILHAATPQLPPAKFVEGGIAQDSIVGAGTIISGGDRATARCSPPTCGSSAGAEVSRTRCSCPACAIGRGAVVRGAILDKNVVVPDGAHDRRRPRDATGRATPSARAAWWCSARASPPSSHTRMAASRPSPSGSRVGASRSSSRTMLGHLAQRERARVGGVRVEHARPEHAVQRQHPAGAQEPQRLVEVAGWSVGLASTSTRS